MTIIQNITKKPSYTIFIVGIIFALMIISALAIYFDNQTVRLRTEIKKGNTQIELIRAENAELQNKIATELDTQRLELMASEFQLEKDKKPQYMPVSAQWDLVSNL